MTRVFVLMLCVVGCGKPGLAPTDAGFDFVGFASTVSSESASCSSSNCAAPLKAVTVGSAAEAHARILAVIATLFGATTAEVSANSVVDCTTPAGNCATRFNHDLYKGDGCRGDALLPSAKVVLDQAASVEYVIWTATLSGITQPAAISLSGIKDGKLLGLVFFFDRSECTDPL